MSDNPDGVRFGVGASIDQASIEAAKAAIAGIGGAFAKTFDQIERSKALAQASKDFAAMAVSENDAAKAAIGLAESLKSLNATDKEIDAAVKAFEKEALTLRDVAKAADDAKQKELERISAVEAAAATKADKDLERDESAARRENDRIDRLAAERDAAQSASDVPSGEPSGSGGSGSDLLNRGVSQSFRRLGAGAGALGIAPVRDAANAAAGIEEVARSISILKASSAGIPDAIAGITNALGLTKAATEASTAVTEGAALAEGAQAAATGAVAVTSGGAAVGLGAMLIPLLPIAAIALAAAAAVALLGAAFADAQKKSQAAAAAIKERYAAEDKVDSLARSGATIEEAYKKRADLEAQIADATDRSNEAAAEKAATFENDAKQSGDTIARLRGGNPVYKEYDERIASTKKSAQEASTELAELNKQIEGGSFAAATAKEKAKTDADAKEKSDKDAEAAADKASREAEQAANKQKAAQEKAAREAEQQAEKIKSAQEAISKAQENNANKQIDQARANAEKIASINQSAHDKTLDTEQNYYRDTVKLAQDARNKETDARAKNAQADYDATLATNRKLEDLRRDALSSEEEATNSRNFLQAAKVREGLEKANKAALEEGERGATDRQTAEKRDEAQRYQDLTRAREERRHQLDNQIADNKTALDRQIRDERLHERQQANDTQIAYARERAALQVHLAELGGITQQAYAQQAAQAQAAVNGGSTQAGIQAQTAQRTLSSTGSIGSFGGLRPITTSAPLNNITNHVTVNANTSSDVYNALQKLGMLYD